MYKQQRPPRRVTVSYYLLSEFLQLHRTRWLPAGAARLPTRLTRLGFIDRKGPACELFAVEPLDGSFGCRTVGHLDKPQAFGAARVLVGNDSDVVHHAIRL